MGLLTGTLHEAGSRGAGVDLVALTMAAERPIDAPGQLEEVYRAVARRLALGGFQILQEKVLAPAVAARPLAAARREAFESLGVDAGTPYTHACYAPCVGGLFAGLQITGVRGAVRCETIRDQGRPVGRLAEGAGQRALFLSQVRGGAGPAGPAIEGMYSRATALLSQHGFSFRDVARTWIRLDDLLGWYGDLNRVRNACFARECLPSADGRYSYPASTGIQGADPTGAGCFMDLVAARPDDGAGPLHQAVASLLQCPAPAYGSAFSRAATLSLWGARVFYLSGTASIAPDGSTCHAGNPEAQVERALEVADAVLHAGGSGLSLAAGGVVYCKNAAVYEAWRRGAGGSAGAAMPPFIPVRADVCRPDLLFEIEAHSFL